MSCRKRYDVQEMYMKPPQKLKRLLRVKVARSTEQGQEMLKVFGYIYPRREETTACRFTSFFRQMTLISEKDKTTLETVLLSPFSGRSQPPTSKNAMDWSSDCQEHLKKDYLYILPLSQIHQDSKWIHCLNALWACGLAQECRC